MTVTLLSLITFFSLSLAASAADLVSGKAKYEQLCITCHGVKGKGDGAAAAALKPRPRDLSATQRSDAELKGIIKNGGPSAGLSPLMVAWGNALTDTDIENVIAYIRSLASK